MDSITIIWSMCAAVYLALAGVHLMIVTRQRAGWWRLLFVVTTGSAAALACFEMWGMHMESVEQYRRFVPVAQIIFAVQIISLMWFIRTYFEAGRLWLLLTATAFRTFSLITVIFATTQGLSNSITHLERIEFLGVTVSVAATTGAFLRVVGHFGLLMVLVFCVDVAVSIWRKGNRRRAVLVGGSIGFFILFSFVQSIVIIWGIAHIPFTYSLTYLAVVLAMGFELSGDVLRSAQLADDLAASEKRMSIAVAEAQLCFWGLDIKNGKLMVSDELKQLFGFDDSDEVSTESIIGRIHPDDRDRAIRKHRDAVVGKEEYGHEYRIIHPDGSTRWIASHGRVEVDNDGRSVAIGGLALDITKRKEAEAAAFELSGRVVEAQEAERTRLSRELHDDLSQSLALLSTELQVFGQKQPLGQGIVRRRMQELSRRVFGISVDVHRMSHDLQPATLERLGLVSAISSFCSEIEMAHDLTVEFEHFDIPESLSEEIELCLYRIVQEALQNVAKHSKASFAKVVLKADADEIELTVTDDGAGFVVDENRASGSTGLVNMRERARLVGGRLSIRTRVGEGTVISVNAPLAFLPGSDDNSGEILNQHSSHDRLER